MKGNFITWPGIESLNFQKLLGTTVASELGHLDQECKNLRSTKLPDSPCTEDPFTDAFPEQVATKSYNCFCRIEKHDLQEKPYNDLTGKFLLKSTRGHQYLLIVYDYDSNAIMNHPLKSQNSEDICEAWEACHKKITRHGHAIFYMF